MLPFTNDEPLEPEPCSLCGRIPEVTRARWSANTER
jgi:hypothetical protein